METKQLVDKFIKGEITEEQFDTEKSKLTPEQLVELNKEAEARKPDAVEVLKNIRRGADKIVTEKDISLATQIQRENLEAAELDFFKEFGIEKAEDRIAFKTGFKTESINVTNIIKDMKKHYVAQNPERYLELEKEKKNREREADNFNSQGAGGGQGGGGDGKPKISEDVKAAVEAFRKKGRIVTPEFAEKALRAAANKGKIS